jgi:ketosteroid isomerase-like protein
MTNNADSVKEIQAAMDKWSKALCEKNLIAMHEEYAKQYRLFDVQETADGVEAVKALWEKCFPMMDKPTLEYKNLVIEASDDMAVVYFNSRMSGFSVPIPEEMSNAWLRGTACFRKIDGVWKCIHEHISFPVDCMTNSIAFENAA